jgi:hypothetical protein
VDGLGHVFKVDEGWPRAPGAVAIWDSKPGGRGRVLERVVSFEARVDELLLDVLEDDVEPGGGDRLCDLSAHRSGADDGGLEHEHVSVQLLVV